MTLRVPYCQNFSGLKELESGWVYFHSCDSLYFRECFSGCCVSSWGLQKMAWLRCCEHIKSAETVRDLKHFAMDAKRKWQEMSREVMVCKVIRMSTKQICKAIYIKLPTGRLHLGAIVLIWQDLSCPFLHRAELSSFPEDLLQGFH